MQVKDVDTNQSLNSQNTIAQHLMTYGKSVSEYQLFSHFLHGFNLQSENCSQDMMEYRQQLLQTLSKISKCKKSAFQSHKAVQKIKECICFYNESTRKEVDQKLFQNQIQMHSNFISSFQMETSQILFKISQYWIRRQKTNKVKHHLIKINNLINKKYNIKNYIQQMLLVKDLLARVHDKLNSGNFDYTFLEELISKQFIPYKFYHNYCYNIACTIIAKRTQQKQLIIIKQNANLPILFNEIKAFFFNKKDLFQRCNQFITLLKYVRIINSKHLCVDNGFAEFFKPYFIQMLQQVTDIQRTVFLKSSSLMQYNNATIQIWKEYEEYQIEKYILWNYEQNNLLRKTQLIHLVKVREVISFFRQNYEWINTTGIKSIKIHGSNDFPKQYIKSLLLKILNPIVSHLYLITIVTDKKLSQKIKKQHEDYWIYCIFGKYPNIFQLIGSQIKHSILEKNGRINLNSIEDSQLNDDQYYKYYQQIDAFLISQLSNKNVGKQFKQFWTQIWIRIKCYSQNIVNIKQMMPFCQDEIDHLYHIRQLQTRLQQILLKKKAIKTEQQMDVVYGIVMNLNLNSCNFFLIRSALKFLDKSVEKQINLIREVAYKQFFK